MRALRLLPGDAAQSVELDLGVLRAVARQKLEVFDRQEKLVAIGVMQFEAIMRRAAASIACSPTKRPMP